MIAYGHLALINIRSTKLGILHSKIKQERIL